MQISALLRPAPKNFDIEDFGDAKTVGGAEDDLDGLYEDEDDLQSAGSRKKDNKMYAVVTIKSNTLLPVSHIFFS